MSLTCLTITWNESSNPQERATKGKAAFEKIQKIEDANLKRQVMNAFNKPKQHVKILNGVPPEQAEETAQHLQDIGFDCEITSFSDSELSSKISVIQSHNINMTICKGCSANISSHSNQCPKCGAVRKKPCKVCKTEIPITDTSCSNCGDPSPFGALNLHSAIVHSGDVYPPGVMIHDSLTPMHFRDEDMGVGNSKSSSRNGKYILIFAIFGLLVFLPIYFTSNMFNKTLEADKDKASKLVEANKPPPPPVVVNVQAPQQQDPEVAQQQTEALAQQQAQTMAQQQIQTKILEKMLVDQKTAPTQQTQQTQQTQPTQKINSASSQSQKLPSIAGKSNSWIKMCQFTDFTHRKSFTFYYQPSSINIENNIIYATLKFELGGSLEYYIQRIYLSCLKGVWKRAAIEKFDSHGTRLGQFIELWATTGLNADTVDWDNIDRWDMLINTIENEHQLKWDAHESYYIKKLFCDN